MLKPAEKLDKDKLNLMLSGSIRNLNKHTK